MRFRHERVLSKSGDGTTIHMNRFVIILTETEHETLRNFMKRAYESAGVTTIPSDLDEIGKLTKIILYDDKCNSVDFAVEIEGGD